MTQHAIENCARGSRTCTHRQRGAADRPAAAALLCTISDKTRASANGRGMYCEFILRARSLAAVLGRGDVSPNSAAMFAALRLKGEFRGSLDGCGQRRTAAAHQFGEAALGTYQSARRQQQRGRAAAEADYGDLIAAE